MRDAIRGHQRSSEAISDHQRSSEVFISTTPAHARPPMRACTQVIRGHQRSSARGHQYTCACMSSDESIEHRGCIPLAAAIASPSVELPARCLSVRAAAACVAKLPFERSSMRRGRPFERVMRPVGKQRRRRGEPWHTEGRDAIRSAARDEPLDVHRGNQRQSNAII